MLAMIVNDNAYCLDKRGALKSIASKLAPTGNALPTKKPPLRAAFSLHQTKPYNFGPAALIASLTSNFLKFSMNKPASALADSS